MTVAAERNLKVLAQNQHLFSQRETALMIFLE